MPKLDQYERAVSALGNTPPLLADGRGGPPDRREVSARWLSGTFLTGLTSSVLMGVALFAALDGRQLLATPPEIAALNEIVRDIDDASVKQSRIAVPSAPAGPLDRRRMEVSTIQRVDDRDLVRTVPFVEVKMALAAGHKTARKYPSFNPLNVFAEGPDPGVGEHATGLIYGAKVESDVTLHTVDFPVDSAVFEQSNDLTAAEAEAVVRSAGAVLAEGAVQVASLHYVDPQRFASGRDTGPFAANYGVTVIQENVSIVKPSDEAAGWLSYSDEIVPVRQESAIGQVFESNGYVGAESESIANALRLLLKTDTLLPGTVLRLGIEYDRDERRIVRASVYKDGNYVDGIAVDDRGQLAPAIRAPEFDDRIASVFRDDIPQPRVRADLPSAYDAIYNAAYSYGLSSTLTAQLIKMLAAEVDFRSRIGPGDNLHVLFSNPADDNQATDNSELLFVQARFGNNERKYYRFRLPDGSVDFFDAEGRSARQFLLRNPVPNGKFRSGFGMRRHPITRIYKKHTGVDWSAPRGTPIISAGSGTVQKAGWAGGYGRQTIIKHANGYTTSYSHQSAIARGIRPGARVRQGQIIGYVGSSGLSTGNHLHYELIVNRTKVDPMRVRLPTGKVLKDADLAAFTSERERIDALLKDGSDEEITVASR